MNAHEASVGVDGRLTQATIECGSPKYRDDEDSLIERWGSAGAGLLGGRWSLTPPLMGNVL